jgi:hypothetical protein
MKLYVQAAATGLHCSNYRAFAAQQIGYMLGDAGQHQSITNNLLISSSQLVQCQDQLVSSELLAKSK